MPRRLLIVPGFASTKLLTNDKRKASGRDVVLLPGLLPILLQGCGIKSGWGLGTRLKATHLIEETALSRKNLVLCKDSIFQISDLMMVGKM